MKITIAFIIFSLVSLNIHSASIPSGTTYDSRIQNVMYNPDDVIVVRVAQGTSTLIQLEDGETLEAYQAGIGIGDAEAWSIGVRGNNIFMKPKANAPDTNITLVTNKRTYAFSLKTSRNSRETTYILRFIYPIPPESLIPEPPKELACSNSDSINISYQAWGDKSLAPHSAWDDGRMTCFRYPIGTDLPAIYRMVGGEEILTNAHVDGDIVVIHGVASEYRFRLGNQVLGVKTDNLRFAPFNESNTTIRNTERVSK